MKRQSGFTLMELIAGLLIIGLGVAGAMALFGNASGSQKSNQMLSDVMALRASVQGMYAGQGGYGTGNINAVLKSANKIPTTMSVNSATPPVITHSMSGTVTITGASSSFEIALTNIPTNVCVQILSQSTTGWSSVKVGASSITTFPITPAVAASATNCAASNANTITFVGS